MLNFVFPGVVAIVILLMISAFFSGSETALTAVSPATMHRLEQRHSRAARGVNALLEDREPDDRGDAAGQHLHQHPGFVAGDFAAGGAVRHHGRASSPRS